MERNKLIAYALKYQGDYNQILKAILTKEEAKEIEANNCLTILDEGYPKEFLCLKSPPFVLFYKGNLDLLKEEKIAIVGSRKACTYALEATKLLALKNADKVIVSGLAKGIDAKAHTYATKTIGVIGCGIDYIYPIENKLLYQRIEKEGLLISEYPSFCKPLSYHFPFRNRLIASLANTVYIMQSSEKSGTITTVNEALELGKDIKVLPYDIFMEEGIYNNQLINDGALIIKKEEIV